jgi:uracil-DNA glycosylase family 4
MNNNLIDFLGNSNLLIIKHMNNKLRERYGYPTKCDKCAIFEDKPKGLDRIDPFYDPGNKIKLLLIGQDPTILKNPERVKTVLMLEDNKGRKGQLRKWLETELFGEVNFREIEIYATNLVKCQFDFPPSQSKKGAFNFLSERYEKCKDYIFSEINNYNPDIILTLGESAHKLFIMDLILDENLKSKMSKDFTGNFYKAKLNSIEFYYSPCLHIKTFRVADTYGNKVVQFKNGLKEMLK